MLLVHKTLVACLFLQILFLSGVVALPWFSWPLLIVSLTIVLGTIAQIVRKKSVRSATYSLLYTNVFAIGLARGVLKPQLNPLTPIQSIVLKQSARQVL
jgi:hypothetical protein